ncbi:hypothetical protein SAMN05216257_101537 [Meinhardsimonia xiamenensis]|jgi:hypothetical protein|uniref:Uncharacterized protein n=1 Tax=Meinhardsimonia xiamenensis TaxID=990712 RepID=A0A1G8Z163_9RHOB|nr:hypothetical protein LV81_01292 [Meinhardsimonia xiamenensis]SDK08859.1 hypothetical protein SAMN05216257_101537 [Meinhardsimonia xiamenensis]
MGHDWILDVLADLKTYARQNGLSALASQLDETILVAAAEAATSQNGTPLAAMGHAATARGAYRAIGRGGNG